MANEYMKRNQAIIGGLPLTGGVTFDEFEDARLNGLLKDINNTNNFIAENDLLKQPVPQVDKKMERRKALQDIADRFGIINAQQSGNYQAAANMQNALDQRKQQEEQQKKLKTEQDLLRQQQQEFMKTLDPNSDLAQKIRINQLFGFTPSSPAQNKTTKSDFVVEILEKMKNNPGYKLTDTDQRILDTIGDTDPMKIMIRNRLNEMQVNNFSNENTNQSGPVTITTAEQFDSLPKGTKYIYSGTEYIKGQ